MKSMKEMHVTTRSEWRKWFVQNHDKSSGIWLIFYKKHTGKSTLEYDAAVEEALCFGWIDSIIKKIDEEKYARKFTPRKRDSHWSKLNRKRVEKVIREGRMTAHGLVKIEAAKKSGLWDENERPEINVQMPEELDDALAQNIKAKGYFDQLAPSYQKHFMLWILTAKRKDTKERRVEESIRLLEQGRKLGLK